jgi:hypothetical protein
MWFSGLLPLLLAAAPEQVEDSRAPDPVLAPGNLRGAAYPRIDESPDTAGGFAPPILMSALGQPPAGGKPGKPGTPGFGGPISQNVHAYLKEKDVPHIWHVDGNAHDATHWKNSLYHFAQRIFR